VFRDQRVIVISDHAAAVLILAAAGQTVPAIPPGCNTVMQHFTTAGGVRALAVNQTGFHRTLDDDEGEVNGCTIFSMSASLGSTPDDDDFLRALHRHILTSPGTR